MAPLANALELFEKIQSADISVHPQRCVVVRNRRATCSKCADACTSGAISVRDNELFVAGEQCIGCGTCATVCPTCALEAHRPNDAQLATAVLAAARANGGEAVIACRRLVEAAADALDAEKIVAVECLGRVEESLLTALAAAGARRVVLAGRECEACEHVAGFRAAGAVCSTMAELMSAWQCPMTVEMAEKLPSSVRAAGPKGYDESRRNFFFRAQEGARLVAGVAAEAAVREAVGAPEEAEPPLVKVMDDGTLPHFVPDRRERILDNLSALGEPEDRLLMTRLWGHVVIDAETCNSCRMCATFCPTGAIAKFDNPDGILGVTHTPADCVKCGSCQDICPADAITLLDAVPTSWLVNGESHRYDMTPRAVQLTDNPHQILETFRLSFNGDIFER